MPTQVFYIVSNINKAIAFEWIVEEIDQANFSLNFILLNEGSSTLEEWLKAKGVLVFYIQYRGKKDIPAALLNIVRILKKEKADIVHCHLFDASLIGLTAAKLAGISKRIYTRHYSTFHHQYFPKAVWYDRYINLMATHIVAISKNVQEVLSEKEGVAAKKISLIHHGFRLEEFGNVPEARVLQLQKRYNTVGKHPVIGVISRYFELKGIQYIIPAFQRLLQDYPDAHLVLANATGNYTAQIQQLLEQIPVKHYSEIIFEEDLSALYQLFDVFVHVPINRNIEAFGQIYVEALAAGIPAIYTLSGVATEFVENERNALVVDYKNADQIYAAILRILTNETLAQQMAARGKEDIKQYFSLETYISKLENLYKSI